VAQLTRTVDPTSALIGIAVLSALAALVLRRPRLIR
jgi:hypothetical protein